MTKAQTLHQEAETAREKEEFLKSLELTDQAILAYYEEKDLAGVAEVLSSRFLTLRHLFEQTEEEAFMVMAKNDAEASVEIARKCDKKEALAIPLFNLGKANEALGKFGEAVEAYKEAIANMTKNPPAQHNRSGVMQEMIIHLSTAEYLTGDKSALERLEDAIEDLTLVTDEPEYNKDVWLSGGYMDIAELLKDTDRQKTKMALEKAREIIDSNPALILRKKQLEKLETKFK